MKLAEGYWFDCMGQPKKKSFVIKLISVIAACLCAGFVVYAVISHHVRARNEAAANTCINNLRQLNVADYEWTPEKTANLLKFIKTLKCPSGGTYELNTNNGAIIGVTCSLGTSVTPPHVLP